MEISLMHDRTLNWLNTDFARNFSFVGKKFYLGAERGCFTSSIACALIHLGISYGCEASKTEENINNFFHETENCNVTFMNLSLVTGILFQLVSPDGVFLTEEFKGFWAKALIEYSMDNEGNSYFYFMETILIQNDSTIPSIVRSNFRAKIHDMSISMGVPDAFDDISPQTFSIGIDGIGQWIEEEPGEVEVGESGVGVEEDMEFFHMANEESVHSPCVRTPNNHERRARSKAKFKAIRTSRMRISATKRRHLQKNGGSSEVV